MKTLKSLISAAAVSISLFTLLNLLHSQFRPAYFDGQKLFSYYVPIPIGSNLFGVSTIPQVATIGLAVYPLYAAIGIFLWTLVKLFRDNKFGLKKESLLHFLVSSVVFYLLLALLNIPFWTPLKDWGGYFGLTGHIDFATINYFFLQPIVNIILSYLLVYLVFYLYYRHQIKKLNNQLSSRNKSH